MNIANLPELLGADLNWKNWESQTHRPADLVIAEQDPDELLADDRSRLAKIEATDPRTPMCRLHADRGDNPDPGIQCQAICAPKKEFAALYSDLIKEWTPSGPTEDEAVVSSPWDAPLPGSPKPVR